MIFARTRGRCEFFDCTDYFFGEIGDGCSCMCEVQFGQRVAFLEIDEKQWGHLTVLLSSFEPFFFRRLICLIRRNTTKAMMAKLMEAFKKSP